jgi:hypothetical protein
MMMMMMMMMMIIIIIIIINDTLDTCTWNLLQIFNYTM